MRVGSGARAAECAAVDQLQLSQLRQVCVCLPCRVRKHRPVEQHHREPALQHRAVQWNDPRIRHRNDSRDVATTFNLMTLSSSTFALISEMWADISYLNLFSIWQTPVVYSRSIS